MQDSYLLALVNNTIPPSISRHKYASISLLQFLPAKAMGGQLYYLPLKSHFLKLQLYS